MLLTPNLSRISEPLTTQHVKVKHLKVIENYNLKPWKHTREERINVNHRIRFWIIIMFDKEVNEKDPKIFKLWLQQEQTGHKEKKESK